MTYKERVELERYRTLDLMHRLEQQKLEVMTSYPDIPKVVLQAQLEIVETLGNTVGRLREETQGLQSLLEGPVSAPLREETADPTQPENRA